MKIHKEDAKELIRRIKDGDEMAVPGMPGQPQPYKEEFAQEH